MTQNKPLIHFTASYLLNPVHPVTVDLVGCGGSGSMMLSSLARINAALKQLGHPGLEVTAFDDDIVEPTNLGRQLFSEGDLYVNKANALVTRFNRCYGTRWEAVPERYRFNDKTNIIISCTDNIASRKDIQAGFGKKETKGSMYGDAKEYENYYWLDLGNTKDSGQAILGSKDIKQPVCEKFTTVSKLRTVTEMFELTKEDEKLSGPSCSLAEALAKQDLFINSSLAQLASSLLWSLLHEGHIEYQGLFLNLGTMNTRPLSLEK